MKHLLVVANETVGGTALIDAVKQRAEGGEVKVTVICPQNDPRGGWVIYDDAARGADENRLQTTLAQLREVGIDADGEVMDPDPYAATMDAIHAYSPDEVIISTHPETRSGWMRKDLPSRVEDDSGLPVEHVVVDLVAEREDAVRTLVVANQTVDSDPLHDRIVERIGEGNHQFTIVVPVGVIDSYGGGFHLVLDLLAARHDVLHGLGRCGLDALDQVRAQPPRTLTLERRDQDVVDGVELHRVLDRREGVGMADLTDRLDALVG